MPRAAKSCSAFFFSRAGGADGGWARLADGCRSQISNVKMKGEKKNRRKKDPYAFGEEVQSTLKGRAITDGVHRQRGGGCHRRGTGHLPATWRDHAHVLKYRGRTAEAWPGRFPLACCFFVLVPSPRHSNERSSALFPLAGRRIDPPHRPRGRPLACRFLLETPANR